MESFLKNLKHVLEYYNMSDIEFHDIINKHRNEEIWIEHNNN